MTPTDLTFAKSLETKLLEGCIMRVGLSDKNKTFSEKILSIKTIGDSKVIYDEVLGEALSDMNISHLATYSVLKNDTEIQETINSARKLLDFAETIFGKTYTRLALSDKFSNYLFSTKQKAISIYFNLPCSSYSDANIMYREEEVKEKVRSKIIADLKSRSEAEKEKITKELDQLKLDLDQETYEGAKEQTQMIHDWLNNIIQETRIETISNVNEMLNSWPVVFSPAPWEI